ncbi:nitrous oxide reductase accessory protein NosL [Winogradskyella jejuensis]|uniref:Copper chaperone NosL n=1 Tax=Winogradskyella jejuensis TaxID=1089305 RepID=A0A1M5KRE3_9FLAO|nr:nitrous oxide reductase accessory protein NosL [Winogradskyella jejuensis]SHG55089.1 copper chaperone NosL [Winogradskyella jejuensis]
MKTTIKFTISALILLLLSSCNTGPQTIDYGNDGCHFCKMTIVDKIHGAELINDKGKVYKFDATECMLNYTAENAALINTTLLTNYYEAPTEFINVEEATFLISKNLPSPMGANLTAFQNKEEAEKMKAEKGGKLYDFKSLKSHLGK